MFPQQQDSLSHLYLSIEFGFKKKAYNLIMSGIDVNANVGDNTPLHWAIIKLDVKNLDIVTMLIRNGADVHARNHDNYTPLDIAIQDGKTKFATQLIRHGALVGEDLNLLLLKAIKKNNHDIVQTIINYGMMNVPSIDSRTILKAAFLQKNSKIIRAIIPFCGFSKPSDLYIPEEFVKKSDLQCRKITTLLLKWEFIIHPNSHHDKDFVYGAVKNGYLSIVLQLLNSGINVNMMNLSSGLNLLTIACLNRHYEIIEQLLEHGADISCTNRCLVTPLYLTSYGKKLPVMEVLFQKNNDPNATDYGGQTAFHVACIFRSDATEDIIKLLLRYGGNIDVLHTNGSTPLHTACEMGNSEAVKCLLDNDANIHAKNYEGQTPLHAACKHSNDMTLNILELLLDRGANTEAVDNRRWTPLSLACHHNNYLAVVLLLYHNANPNHMDFEKSTPLHIAVKHACIKMIHSFKTHRTVEALIAHGANINIFNKKNRTPLHNAIEKMLSYDNDDSYCASARRKNCGVIIKSLVTQGIKLKTAGLKVMEHHSSVVYNSNDYIIIDNIKYSANDILHLNIHSDSNQVISLISNNEFFGFEDFIGDIRLVEAACKQEIEEMKKESVGIDDLTFYDLARMNIHSLRRLVKNDKFSKLLEMAYFNRKFPLYNDIIKNKLQRAKSLDEHYELRMPANEYFMLNVTQRLPYECIDKVLSFLNVKELSKFIEEMKR